MFESTTAILPDDQPPSFSPGLLHFAYNNECTPASFIANFGNKDPGTQVMYNSLMHVPSHILQAATGLPLEDVQLLKAQYLLTSPATGGDECLKRCGLTFQTVSQLGTIAAGPSMHFC